MSAAGLARRGWSGSIFFGFLIVGLTQLGAALMGLWRLDSAPWITGVGVIAAIAFEIIHRRADRRRFAPAVALADALYAHAAGQGEVAAGWHAGAPFVRGRLDALSFVCHFETAGMEALRVALVVEAQTSAPLWLVAKDGPRPERFFRRLSRRCAPLSSAALYGMALDEACSAPLLDDPQFEAAAAALLALDEGAMLDLQGDSAGWDAPLRPTLTAEDLLDRATRLAALAAIARRLAPTPQGEAVSEAAA
ncbi:hypothetical protein KKF91_02650 [Myxococcota bacterium]|nr:hypothetical protein [Myxococcota bacterium]MBU1429440.1 hypothetical protein [Myxococcota bacterium]MBU1897728.1 hypothetical protein [Myxococcota bacterium]